MFCLYSGYRLAAAILWLLPSPFPSVQRKQIYTDMSESNANCWPKSVAFLLSIINTALSPPLSLLIRFLLKFSFLPLLMHTSAPERNVGVIKQTEDRYRKVPIDSSGHSGVTRWRDEVAGGEFRGDFKWSQERWTTGEGLRMRWNFRFQLENSTTYNGVLLCILHVK